ncbi:MAG: RNA 3'-terminal phosphate cyclase [Candidatus Bathyarchaeota archaeon]|nr:MAG: RNA 3'-terminal phosphate cyclase [Candidatus Bathyarchaeota archaeon]
MLRIDGSRKSGSGTILRIAIAMAGILNEPLHIYNIRQKRPQPGLKPQHLEAVLTAAKLCNATIKGAKLGSKELWFYPNEIVGGKIKAEIGTAGSIPMLIITVLPLCAFAKSPVSLQISKGGTDVSHSPTINYLSQIFLATLKKMGLDVSLEVHKYGYYPKGMGKVSVRVQPNQNLVPLRLERFEQLESVRGISVCTFLAERKVAERQAKAANYFMKKQGVEANIEVLNDFSTKSQRGSSITLWAQTSTDIILGSDGIGELGKPSEIVGREAAKKLLQEIEANATVDMYLADMVVPYMALAKGESVFFTRLMTDHTETNIWLAKEIFDAKFHTSKIGNLYRVRKLAN